jgi:hypothetical protein
VQSLVFVQLFGTDFDDGTVALHRILLCATFSLMMICLGRSMLPEKAIMLGTERSAYEPQSVTKGTPTAMIPSSPTAVVRFYSSFSG